MVVSMGISRFADLINAPSSNNKSFAEKEIFIFARKPSPLLRPILDVSACEYFGLIIDKSLEEKIVTKLVSYIVVSDEETSK